MAEGTEAETFEVVCPHCKKTFEAALLGEDAEAARYRGFKCPFCKLFVPADRAEPEDAES